jgi:Mrp family chromosome partitioning ATPase
VEWGALDYLLIDSPPGTSDEHMSTTSLLKDAGITGAVIVTTPSKVALIDVQRQLAFCRKGSLMILNSLKTISVDLKIIGLIENMAGFVCPKCTKESEIFRKSGGGVQEFCDKNDVAYLGALPIDPKICQAMDTGENPMDVDSPAISKLNKICDQIQSYCQKE